MNLPNFCSVGSGEEEEEEIATVSEAEPNPEPNNFDSGFDFGSGDKTLLLKDIIRSMALAYRAENSYPVENLFNAISLIDNGKTAEAKSLIAPDLKEFMRHSESSKKQSSAISQLFNLILAEPTEPNNFAPEAKKRDNHAVSAPPEPNYPKSTHPNSNTQQKTQQLDDFSVGASAKIGDRVDFLRYKQACEKFHKIKNLPDSHYTITELAMSNGVLMATIKHQTIRASLVVPTDWLMESMKVTA